MGCVYYTPNILLHIELTVFCIFAINKIRIQSGPITTPDESNHRTCATCKPHHHNWSARSHHSVRDGRRAVVNHHSELIIRSICVSARINRADPHIGARLRRLWMFGDPQSGNVCGFVLHSNIHTDTPYWVSRNSTRSILADNPRNDSHDEWNDNKPGAHDLYWFICADKMEQRMRTN